MAGYKSELTGDAVKNAINKVISALNGSTSKTLAVKEDLNSYVSTNQGRTNSGKFLTVDSNGNISLTSLSTWQGGSY